MLMPSLHTSRLVIRPFIDADLDSVHRLLDIELRTIELGNEGAQTREERAAWLQWAVLNYAQLAKLYQPPYGDRAIMLRETGAVIGACGFVPCLGPFDQLPSRVGAAATLTAYTTELGLFYAISLAHQRRGYATEAMHAMITYAFNDLHLLRIVATTTHENAASIGVMRKLGMRVEKNPHPDPPWFQVVGILAAP